jgi:cysteinyl-tRNA synthetase
MLQLYNSLSRRKEELKPIHKDWVGLYTCGPTVYNFAHIGNLRTYIFEDILQRTLEYNGLAVKRVMNITDVGHLTSDADTGEDKLDKAAQAQHKSIQEIAQYYTNTFFEDLAKLNIQKPENIAPATEFVPQQIDLIKILFEKRFAYDTPTAVYFDVSQFKDYGKLSGQSLKEKSIGARAETVIDKEKHNAADFVLWFKLVGKFENHILHWPSPWGEGFPGWHLECSAISRHFLGQPFDIHTGGVDHIGTHHENEIAQSEAAFGLPLANIWMHGEFLLINEGRMGKSADNFITLADLEKKGYNPLVYRYFTLGAHYRTQLNFTWEALDAARNGLERLYRTIYDYSQQTTNPNYNESALNGGKEKFTLEEYEHNFIDAINDDLNVAKALGIMQEMLADHGSPSKKLILVKKFDKVFGLNLEKPMEPYSFETDSKISAKATQYQQFRTSKQFVQSDALRKEIEDLGYTVRDTESGPYIVKKFF